MHVIPYETFLDSYHFFFYTHCMSIRFVSIVPVS